VVRVSGELPVRGAPGALAQETKMNMKMDTPSLRRLAGVGLVLASLSAQAEDVPVESVTVLGKQSDVDRRWAASTQKTVIDRKEVEAMGGLTVGEVLGKLPGVEASDGSGGMRARGMVRDSVLILVDGESVSANARMALGMVSRLSSSEIERIEILRGSSAEYGGGSAVTVNLIMKKAVSKESLELKVAAGVRAGEPNGQFNVTKGGAEGAYSWLLPLSIGLHGSVSEKSKERQQFTAGTRSLLETEEERGVNPLPSVSFSPRLAWKQGSDSVTLWPTLLAWGGPHDTTVTTRSTAPGAAVSDRIRLDSADDRTVQARLRADAETRFEDTKLTLRTALSSGRRDADTRYQTTTNGADSATSTESLVRRESDANAALRLDHSLDGHTLSSGLELVRHSRRDEQTVVSPITYSASAAQSMIWVQDEWAPSQQVVLTGGVRVESLRMEVDETRRQFHHFAPSVTVRWAPDAKWVFRSSLGTAIKVPKLDELSDRPVSSLGGNSPLEPDSRGNPTLRPERSVNLEAVIEHYLPAKAGVLGANLYWRRTSDFVEQRVALEGARWVDRPYNEGVAQHWGLELDAKLPTDEWGQKGGTVRAHLTLPWSRVDDERLGLRREARDTPDYQLTLGLDQQVSSWKASWGVQAQLFGPQATQVAQELVGRVRARQVIDLYGLKSLAPNLNLRLGIQNLLGSPTDKSEASARGVDAWQLDTQSRSRRNLSVALEGKW
jgi:outer membrane receptor for ferrienterochelin and colicins